MCIFIQLMPFPCLPLIQWNLSNVPQLGMSVLWWISGVGGLMRFAFSTCILIRFLDLGWTSEVGGFIGGWISEVSLYMYVHTV